MAPTAQSAVSTKPAFGLAIFQRPAKAYTTKDGKSTMVARILVPYGSFVMEATCWCKTLENKQQGETTLEYTIGFPRGLSVNDDVPGSGEVLDGWKDSILANDGPFDKWLASLTTSGNIVQSAPRLVKTIKAQGQVAITPAPQTVPSK